MSGNFDFPPASTTNASPNSNTPPSDSLARFQHLRELLQSSRGEDTRIESPEAARIQLERRQRRRRRVELSAQARDRLRALGRSPSSGVIEPHIQAASLAQRSRPTLNDHYIHRRRQRRQQHLPTLSESIGTVQQAVERLNQASSNLSSLLDEPLPRIVSTSSTPDISSQDERASQDVEADGTRRRTKRRKLNVDRVEESFKAFRYGHCGQVVPGPLKMEIASCDGGHYTSNSGHPSRYRPENVLYNDTSVYCTESNECNIVLQHQAETPFCLQKLVIKAPEKGFDAPIQEGMIFIAMESDDLLERTSSYHLDEPCTSPLPLAEDLALEPSTHARSSQFPEAHSQPTNENRPPSRRADLSATRLVPPPISDNRVDEETLERWAATPRSPAIDTTPALISSFTVTTDCDDASDEEEGESSPEVLSDRFQRDMLTSSYPSSDDELSQWTENRPRSMGPPMIVPGSRRRAQSSQIEVRKLSGMACEGNISGPMILAPHATFFIERKKSMVAIKFEPPVSGRYILVKLWSPSENRNIDIQCIVAYGFAGPRFFPAMKMM